MKTSFTYSECMRHAERAAKQYAAMNVLNSSDYERELVILAESEWTRRAEIAKVKGFWEHEYEPLQDLGER